MTKTGMKLVFASLCQSRIGQTIEFCLQCLLPRLPLVALAALHVSKERAVTVHDIFGFCYIRPECPAMVNKTNKIFCALRLRFQCWQRCLVFLPNPFAVLGCK